MRGELAAATLRDVWRASLWLLCLTMGCGAVRAPRAASREVPPADPTGAVVVFLLDRSPEVVMGWNEPPAVGDRGLPPPRIPLGVGLDILDEEGELLGRLIPGSWLAVRRPPGSTTFYAVPTTWSDVCVGGCPDGDASVAILRAELDVGHHYAVWIGSVRTRVGTDEAMENRCRSWVEGDLLQGFWTRGLDLIGVGPERWPDIDAMLEDPRIRAMRPAPRGLRHPHADAVRLHAEARVGRCWSSVVSALGAREARTLEPSPAPLR